MTELFQVWFSTKFAPDSRQQEFPQPVDVKKAMNAALRLTTGAPSCMMQQVLVVCVNDDTCNFEWEDGKLIFPSKEDIQKVRAKRN